MSSSLFKIMFYVLIWSLGIVIFSADASATKKVYSPYVEKGELELEARGNVNFDDRDDVDNTQTQKYAIGYGVTRYWFTELYGEIEKEYNDDGEDLDFAFTEVEWENKFQLTPKGKYPVDLGFLLEYAVSVEDKHPDNLEWALLVGKEIGKTEHYANFKFEHTVGGGREHETEAGFAWSSRYRLAKFLEPGFEYHAEFGGLHEGKSFNEQSHQTGPVFYGKIGNVRYDIGYLFGISDAVPDGMLKWMLEYEYRF